MAAWLLRAVTEELRVSLLIRILKRPPRGAEMRRTDERRGSGVPEIDQNQSTGEHGEGRNVGPVRLDTLNRAV